MGALPGKRLRQAFVVGQPAEQLGHPASAGDAGEDQPDLASGNHAYRHRDSIQPLLQHAEGADHLAEDGSPPGCSAAASFI